MDTYFFFPGRQLIKVISALNFYLAIADVPKTVVMSSREVFMEIENDQQQKSRPEESEQD